MSARPAEVDTSASTLRPKYYPTVLSEDETMDRVLAGESLSRFGDGELRLAAGVHSAASQKLDPRLTRELKLILRLPISRCLVGIPNLMAPSPKATNWERYGEKKYTDLYLLPVYGSSLVSRPDSAPWIDRPDYWEKIKRLWRGKRVVLVRGAKSSLSPELMDDAASVRIVAGPARDAYSDVDAIQADVLRAPGEIVLLSLGAAATVLAARLAPHVHAVDLGHIGMFMKSKSRVPAEALAEVGGVKDERGACT